MSFHLMGYELDPGQDLMLDRILPDELVDEEFARQLVGDYPNLCADVFPLTADQVRSILVKCDLTVDVDALDYFLQFYND